jgi:Secretion system C-terminal sorting domain
MKNFILFFGLLFFGNLYSQVEVQISYKQVAFEPYPNYLSMDMSSDVQLNQIFANHGINQPNHMVLVRGGFDLPLPAENNNRSIVFYDGLNLNGFLNDLNAYSSVVENAKVAEFPNQWIYNNVLKIGLLNTSNGTYLNTTGNVVVTNNTSLNTVFQNFGVSQYQNNIVKCNCNIQNLKVALGGLTTVISSSDYIENYGLLETKTFTNDNISVYPNPFQDKVTIESNDAIENYVLTDVLGKEIVVTNSKIEFESKSEDINSGVYFLKLTFENGKTSNVKLIKK